MKRVINFIPNIVGSYKELTVLAFFLTFILIFQGIFHFVIQDSTVVWQGTCSHKGWNQTGDLGMVVDCGEHGEGTLRDTAFLRSYLNKPGQLMCKLSAAGKISCENLHPQHGEGS